MGRFRADALREMLGEVEHLQGRPIRLEEWSDS
jgi:hypothetical protein